jgi:hypothetical protein
MNTPDVISQLKQARVIVIEGADTDEETDNRNLAETVDLTLDPSVGQILAMAQYFDGIISDVLNIPPTVRGQQSGYQSAKVVDNTQTQSSKGLAYLFKNFMLWVKEVLEYSVDLYKVMAPDDELGREHLQLLVGDAMVDLLSMDTVKEMQFEDFLLALNPTDYVGEAEKAKLSELALSVATSGASRQILKDYLKLDSLDSKTEQINYLEAEIYKDEQREAAQMQAEREAKMAQAELAANAQQQLGQLQSDTTLENTAMNNMAKMAADQNKQAPR